MGGSQMAGTVLPFVEQVRSLAEKFSTVTVKVMPGEPRARAAYEVDLDPDEFLEAMSLLRPRVVYVETSDFRAKWQIVPFHNWSKGDDEEDEGEDGVDDDDDDDDDVVHIPSEEELDRTIAKFPAVKAEVRKWSGHDGQLYMVAALFFADGVYHTMSLVERWMQEFYVSRAQLKISHIESAVSAGRNSRSKRRTVFLERAEQLANNPMFTAPKATREKREDLASKLFPDLEESEWGALVAEAANIIWYRVGGERRR